MIFLIQAGEIHKAGLGVGALDNSLRGIACGQKLCLCNSKYSSQATIHHQSPKLILVILVTYFTLHKRSHLTESPKLK